MPTIMGMAAMQADWDQATEPLSHQRSRGRPPGHGTGPKGHVDRSEARVALAPCLHLELGRSRDWLPLGVLSPLSDFPVPRHYNAERPYQARSMKGETPPTSSSATCRSPRRQRRGKQSSPLETASISGALTPAIAQSVQLIHPLLNICMMSTPYHLTASRLLRGSAQAQIPLGLIENRYCTILSSKTT